MEPKVSIIVPVFNAQDYLAPCLDSLCNQSMRELEIICVDDGSTDSSPAILKSYAQRDSRIHIVTQQNKRQGAARNSGMDVAQGEYIYFMDADDSIDATTCEILYEAAVRHRADIACGSIRKERRQGNRWAIYFEQEELHTSLEARFNAVNCPPDFYVMHKLIHRATLQKLGLRFAEKVQYEDVMFMAELLHGIERMVTVPGPIYHYIAHKGSTVKGKQTIAKQQQHYEALHLFVAFADHIGLSFSKKHRTVTKRFYEWMGVTILKIKERDGMLYWRLFDAIPIFCKRIRN